MADKSSMFPKFILGAIAGAVAAYFLDGENGARRRTMALDKANSLSGDLKKFADEKMSFIRDRAESISSTVSGSGNSSQVGYQASGSSSYDSPTLRTPRAQSSVANNQSTSTPRPASSSTTGSNLQ